MDQEHVDYADGDPAEGRRSPLVTLIIMVLLPAVLTVFACLGLAALATVFGWLPHAAAPQ